MPKSIFVNFTSIGSYSKRYNFFKYLLQLQPQIALLKLPSREIWLQLQNKHLFLINEGTNQNQTGEGNIVLWSSNTTFSVGLFHGLRLSNGQFFGAIPSTGTQGITGAEWKWVSTWPSHTIPVPKPEGSLPEPAAPSSCHRGDAPGSAGPLSSAKTPT